MRERHRRDIVLKTDPVTREKYWSNEVVTVYKPDEGDWVNAVLDILKGVATAEEVRKKFDIATVNSVYTWIGKYVTQEKALPFYFTIRVTLSPYCQRCGETIPRQPILPGSFSIWKQYPSA